MKELGDKWLTALYDNFKGRPELITNGFNNAGIVDPLETGEHPDEDPFADID